TSDPPRKTIARNPSHLGSYKNAPAGSSSASLGSIVSIGGATAKMVRVVVVVYLTFRAHWSLHTGRLSHRRHLRAVPPLLRAAVSARSEWPGGRGRARCGLVRALHDQRRRAVRGGRDGSRDRVVPQSTLAGVQDRGRHRAGSLRPVSAARRDAVRARHRDVADGGV